MNFAVIGFAGGTSIATVSHDIKIKLWSSKIAEKEKAMYAVRVFLEFYFGKLSMSRVRGINTFICSFD